MRVLFICIIFSLRLLLGIREAQDAKTLKAVGEWLEKRWNGTEYEFYRIVAITEADFNQLKQGKMPEEGK